MSRPPGSTWGMSSDRAAERFEPESPASTLSPHADLDRLASLAAQLVARVRDDDAERNSEWLAKELPEPADWFRLCFALAAMVQPDRTVRQLLAWTAAKPATWVRQTRDYGVKPCWCCGRPYNAASSKARFCSESCAKVATKARKHLRYHRTRRSGCEACEGRAA